MKNIDTLPNTTWQTAYEKGRFCLQKGSLSEAIAAFNNAIEMNASAAEAFHDLGVALHLSGDYAAAVDAFKHTVNLDATLAQAWFNGGNSLCALNRSDEAAHWFQTAVQLKPDYSSAYYNLANLYKAENRIDLAAEAYQLALRADPNFAEAHNNLGTLWLQNGFMDRAMNCFHRAIALCPEYAEALYNLGVALNRLGRAGEAIQSVRRCLEAKPDHGEAMALQVSLLQQICDWPALRAAQSRLEQITQRELLSDRRPSESPFMSFIRNADPQRNLLIAQRWSRWLSQQTAGKHNASNCSERAISKKPLTVAYLSERFRNAATAHLMSGLFARHDHTRFKIIAYSWGSDDGSIYRRRIEQDADEFVDIRGMSDAQAAQRIYGDNVDILVDLMGWMHGHRLGIAARRPAPVQVSYLGYPGTTGASFIDYILADRVVIPQNHQPFFSEKVVYLPDCYQVNDPDACMDMAPIGRSECGLPEHGTVFCSFNTNYKIEPHLFGMWMRILRAVPHSVLWLLVRTPEARENLCAAAGSHGVDPRRLIFAAPLPKQKHLARLKLADLALDTLTVNGHTTVADALSAGVPVVTCLGTHFASRVAGSLLKNIGLDELVVRTTDEYQQLAIQLGCHVDRRTAVKAKLKNNRKVYPLFDCDRFVRNLETAFELMWRNLVSGGRPRSFSVPQA